MGSRNCKELLPQEPDLISRAADPKLGRASNLGDEDFADIERAIEPVQLGQKHGRFFENVFDSKENKSLGLTLWAQILTGLE